MTLFLLRAPSALPDRRRSAVTLAGKSLVIATLLLLSVATLDAQSAEVGMAASLSEADNGSIAQVRLGDEITLSLPENPTTGYRWAVDVLDPHLVSLTAQPYTPDSPALGSGGTAQWLLRPIGPGTTTIKLKQWRPWEGDSSIIGRYTITLQIAR